MPPREALFLAILALFPLFGRGRGARPAGVGCGVEVCRCGEEGRGGLVLRRACAARARRRRDVARMYRPPCFRAIRTAVQTAVQTAVDLR